ncbi:NAD-glutamate dehydrogenase [Propionivibrio sp.]|uniref:NAD-glutamate dehydrogenase n=1 Tax=Propionivibrio sp. TaxID=2212460 RepID=UPI00272EB96E|nr:NAD-glutamate dehydrogenase [Propionivibrio sp.]
MLNESNFSSSLQRNLREISERQKISPALTDHLASYFADIDADNFGDARLEELHGGALQHFRLGQSRIPDKAAVALYTPDFDRHGWHSPHTVIDIVTDDMPFLVDSVTMVIFNKGLVIHRLLHPVLGIERDAQNRHLRSAPRGTPGTRNESWIHLEIDRIGDTQQQQALQEEIVQVLADIRASVEDFAAMRERVTTAINDLAAQPADDTEEISEISDFLRWTASENFVFLGYAHYAVSGDELARTPDGGLGLLRRADHPRFGHCRAGIPSKLADVEKLPSALTLVKADARSIVHRSGYLDFIGVLQRDAAGRIVGQHVFVGLYAAHVYHISTSEIPVVRGKVAAVRAACSFVPGGHNDKTLRNILETYPRDELIEIDTADLQRIAHGIVMLYEHQRVRVFLRNDRWCRYVSALIYTPRDRLDTTIRKRITGLIRDTLQAESVDFFLTVGESRMARLHLIARTPEGRCYEYDEDAIEREVARIVRGWQDELQHNLVEHCGEELGNALLRRYGASLPLAYQDQVPPSSAVSDLERLEAAERSGRIEIKLNAPYGDDGSHQHIKLFFKGQPRPLSTILPVFENLGLTVLSEQPFRLAELALHIADFAVQLPAPAALDDEAARRAFLELVEKLLRGEAENDGFNRLALLAGLDGRRVAILRAYGRYLRQAGLPFSQVYIERCLASHPQIARLLSDLFDARFDPNGSDERAMEIDNELTAALSRVSNLDDDRILSGYRTAFHATMRTNAWQTDAKGQPKDYLSFKISSKLIPFLPKPVPLFEIFVYSPRMEGIHMRGSSVSRGGLRWSDRMEDYRTEGLALVKAQMVKNVVGVPLGAKGCFVGKRLPPPSERDAWLAEGIACYQIYIRGLLDVTDNLIGGKVVPPAHVRRHDGDDPYLVVAADKGTATFSDYANAIAIEYGFWLGDAFASGGSAGYDHKKMGITARGAWEAVKRHFRELGRDTQNEPFTAVGIGDMSGDVFGNGLLRSDKTLLVAAFDHRHIFLDPNPDPAKSFAERQRLFDLPRSSWDDYDKALISEGGGVWKRDVKSIPLSPQVRARLGVDAEQMTPNELMSAILKAPVDLLYNGGIGTYFKASSQSHQDANDRGNDAIRVDASDLRAKVVGEGGNLGFTQKARIEYAMNGGLIYTDALDNSAGVGTSDHEVNIKILTSSLLQSGDMTLKQRDALLASMTDDVGRRVLVDNYQQTQAVSLEATYGRELLNAHGQWIRHLEAKGGLNRAIEFLPDEKHLIERAQMGLGLTAPEIAILLAYTKIALKQAILDSSLPDAPAFQPLLVGYFPDAVAEKCAEQIPAHPLRREIITTQIVSRLVNRMGTTFVQQVGDETGADLEQIVSAWYAASELLGAEALWKEIEALDLKVASPQQMALMTALREMVSAATLQLLASQNARAPIAEVVAAYRDALAQAIAEARSGKEGVEAIAGLLDARARIVGVIELVDLARSGNQPLADVASACAGLDAGLDLAWLSNAIANLPASNRWQARARAQQASDLRTLRQALLQRAPLESAVVNAGRAVVEELKRNAPQDLAMLSAGLIELKRILLPA